MTLRTTTARVTFRRPFLLPGMDAPCPAGTYSVETEEQQIESLSVTAYHRVATHLRIENDPRRPGYAEHLAIEPADLAAALEKDARTP